MNTSTIYLSSNINSTNIASTGVELVDMSTLSIILTGIDTVNIPFNVTINWGDSSDIEVYSAAVTNFATLTSTQYNHIYYPSSTSLNNSLTCTVNVTYLINLSTCSFVVPINVRAPSFYTKVNDMILLQTNIIDTNNSILYTFGTQANGSVVETLLSLQY